MSRCPARSSTSPRPTRCLLSTIGLDAFLLTSASGHRAAHHWPLPSAQQMRFLMRPFVIAAVLATGLVSPVHGAGRCGPYGDLVSTLGADFQETRSATGIMGREGKNLLEVYVSARGTW